jgi:predicted enzyme related to lactoylglutathione lyase
MKFLGAMIGTENAEQLGEFYTKVLGEPTWNEGGWYGWGDKHTSLMIGSHSEVKGKTSEAPRIMLAFNTDDVKKEFERIADLGAAIIAEPYKPQEDAEMWLATLADPDGNYIQLSTPWEG